MKRKGFFIKSATLAVAAIIVLLSITSCYSAPKDKAVVGKVGDKDAYYDELYYIVFNDMEYVKSECNGDENAMRDMLDKMVKEQILGNYARLSLYNKVGIKLSDVSSLDLDSYISKNITEDRNELSTMRDKYGMSERYHRYVLKLDILESGLVAAYEDKIPEEAELKAYIKENFVRFNHVVRYVDNENEDQKELDKITDAHALLSNGSTMYDVIQYTENTDIIPNGGYAMSAETMDESVKNAVIALEFGQTSDIITTEDFNNMDEKVKCYNIFQRLEITDEYIEQNYTSLKNEYINGCIDKDYREIIASLSFTPNKAYEKLDLLNLEKPEKTVDTTVAIIIIIVIAVIAIIVVVAIILKNKYKKKNVSYSKTSGSVTSRRRK